MSGGIDLAVLERDIATARGAAQEVVGRPALGVRPVEPGTGGRAWMAAFPGPAFLCLGSDLAAERSLARVRDVAQALVVAELAEDALDADALRGLGPRVRVLARWRADLPAAIEALERAAAASVLLADWRDAPGRIVASLVEVDGGAVLQQRAHAAYATFAGVTEPLVARQDRLDPGMLAALAAVEQAAAEAGLATSLGGMLGEAAPRVAEAADEMASLHVVPLL